MKRPVLQIHRHCSEASSRSFQVEKSQHFCSSYFPQSKQTALTTAATELVGLVVFIAAIPVALTWQVAVLR